MEVYQQLQQLPFMQDTLLTIGSFDGLHRGHQAIFERLRELKAKTKQRVVLLTFQTHPRNVLDTFDRIKVLTTYSEKEARIRATYPFVDFLVSMPFTTDFAQLAPEAFISELLVRFFHPSVIVVGYDHQFGKNRMGTIFLLRDYEKVFHYKVEESPPFKIGGVVVSSTLIRKEIAEGRVAEARQYLGYPYTLSGVVVEGRKLGRTLAYPTANIRLESQDKVLPKVGVYAVLVWIEGRPNAYQAMMNLGYNPTVSEEGTLHMEVHLFDFDESLYHQTLHIQLIDRLRAEQRFEDIEALKKQLDLDKTKALQVLKA